MISLANCFVSSSSNNNVLLEGDTKSLTCLNVLNGTELLGDASVRFDKYQKGTARESADREKNNTD